ASLGGRGARGPEKVGDQVEMLIAIIEVERVARHIQPEDREIEVIAPDWIALPSPSPEIKQWEEVTEAAHDDQVPYGDGLARVAGVLRTPHHVGKEGNDACP